LQSLLQQEDAQDRELEQAQKLRRRLEREGREAFKAYRKAQWALFEANEKCNLLQKKRDLLSSQVNSLLENLSTNNTPWPLCWHDPRETPSDQLADRFRVAVTHNDNREEGQMTDSTNTKDQLEEAALSDVDKRGSPSGNSSPQDYEALEASLRSELVARYRNKAPLNSTKSVERDVIDQPSIETQEILSISHNETQASPSGTTPIIHTVSISPSVAGKNLPSKDSTESNEERMVDQENLFPRDVTNQSSNNTQENITSSRNETQGSPCGASPIVHPVCISPSVGCINLQSQNSTQSADEKLVNQENLPFGKPQESIPQFPNVSRELPLLVNVSTSNSTSVSLTESNQTPLEFITELTIKEPGENITHTPSKFTSELTVSPFVMPSPTVRNACVHFKRVVNSYDANNAIYEGVDIVNELEQARDDTGVSGPQVDPFWPFCIFELRGRCNDEECRWQHVKDFEWRKFKPKNSLTSPSGLFFSI
jgi:Putative zinc-finger domain